MSRRQVFEFGRHEQEQLRAELQSRERVNQEARLHAFIRTARSKANTELGNKGIFSTGIMAEPAHRNSTYSAITGVARQSGLHDDSRDFQVVQSVLQLVTIRCHAARYNFEPLWNALPRPEPATEQTNFTWFFWSRFWKLCCNGGINNIYVNEFAAWRTSCRHS